jgi:putative transcriptional regulator
MQGEKKLNRIKVVLAEKGRTALWLAERLGRDVGTVSRWNRNVQQPALEVLFEIAAVLEVDVCELLSRENPERSE